MTKNEGGIPILYSFVPLIFTILTIGIIVLLVLLVLFPHSRLASWFYNLRF